MSERMAVVDDSETRQVGKTPPSKGWGWDLVLTLVIFSAVLVLAGYGFKWFEGRHGISTVQASDIIRNFGLALAGIGAATFGVMLAWRRTTASVKQATAAEAQAAQGQETHYTELFTKAVEQLAHENISVRLGAIYSLERIANESRKDHWPIMEVLTAYVREKCPWNEEMAELAEVNEDMVPSPAPDVRAIMTVFGRRKREYCDRTLDLRWVDLCGLWLDRKESKLAPIDFSYSRLSHAGLVGADLSHSEFRGADVSYANLRGASFVEAILFRAKMWNCGVQWADFSQADLSGVDLTRTSVAGANFCGADLVTCSMGSERVLSNCILDKDTEVHPDLEKAKTRRLKQLAKEAAKKAKSP